MAKQAGQLDCESKWIGSIGLWVKTGHFKRVKTDPDQSGYKLGQVDPYFHMNFFIFYK